MSLTSLIAPGRILSAVCCALLFSTIFPDSVAQDQRRSPHKDPLPAVGTIKDYPATGLMTGCGNLYFYPARRTNAAAEAYIFLSRGDGSNAWMNFDGDDIRLQQIKLPKAQNSRGYFYRVGQLRISVVIEQTNPESVPAGEDDSTLKMKITLRRGRAVRIVRAVGSSDC